jgi:hypothetical protein
MFSTGFSMNTDPSLNRPMAERATPREQAARHECRSGVDSERPAGADRPFNQLVPPRPTAVHRYARSIRSGYGAEHEHYAASDTFLTSTSKGFAAFFVCYDLRFADEFCSPPRPTATSCRPTGRSRDGHWSALLRAGRSRTRPTSWA